ncbi:MAG: TolC family protein [Candidatus Binataceae bacterium]
MRTSRQIGSPRCTTRKRSRWFGECAILFAVCVFAIAAPADSAQVLTLPEAVERALNFAPSISVASANNDFTTARVGEFRAPFRPSINGIGEYYQAPGYQEVITNRGLTQLGVGLNYTAYDFGLRMARLRAARYQRTAGTLGVRAAQAQIVFATTVAYFNLLRSREALNEFQKTTNQLNGFVGVIGQLKRTGKAISNNVLQVRTARDSSALALAAGQQTVQQAAIALGSLIGDFAPSNIQVQEITALPPLPGGKLSSNPKLMADKRVIDAAKASVKAAVAERYPTLGIQLTAGFLGVDPPRTFSHEYGASYAGIVNVPIYEGGLITAHINEAHAQQMRAKAQLRLDELTLSTQLADATTRYKQALHQVDILNRSQTTANDSFALYWTRFLGGGSATLLEVLTAYTQAETFRLTRIDQKFAARQAAAQVALIYGEYR